jgi:flavin-dependent dehydrogenase
LSPSAGYRWIAIGDAVASFDPITSQGLFDALSTAVVAAGVIRRDMKVLPTDALDHTKIIESTLGNTEQQRTAVYNSLRQTLYCGSSIKTGAVAGMLRK